MTRIALGLEYNGAHYCGWERQRHCEAVQAVLDASLARVAAHPIETVCAGRTDAGVHALMQVVHFDTPAERPAHAWVLGTNTYLPPAISVAWARPVPRSFHARFAATARRYAYFIVNRAVRPALLAQRVTWERRPLDAERMHAAAAALVGEHDFSAFRASGCQARSPVRRVESLSVARHGEVVRVDIVANAFLYHMVRNVVGVLSAIGRGERPIDWCADVLAGRDRRRAGVTAPAAGLYLAGVRYPLEFDLPSDPAGPRCALASPSGPADAEEPEAEPTPSPTAEVCPLPGLWYAR